MIISQLTTRLNYISICKFLLIFNTMLIITSHYIKRFYMCNIHRIFIYHVCSKILLQFKTEMTKSIFSRSIIALSWILTGSHCRRPLVGGDASHCVVVDHLLWDFTQDLSRQFCPSKLSGKQKIGIRFYVTSHKYL